MLKPAELKRARLVQASLEGQLTVKEVANALGLTERRVKQIRKDIKTHGVESIVHGNRGRKPSHTISQESKEKIIQLRQTYNYEVCNFKHFKELLEEHENIKISYTTLHKILHEAGFVSPKKHRKPRLHSRRKRKASEGMLLQADGTPYEWFGGKEKYSIHGFIDDATGKITGLYMCKNECLNGYLEVLRQTLINYGIPVSLYPDKATVFFSPKQGKDHLTLEEELNGLDKNVTQFGKIVDELGITMFPASCSQAKGRIERLWETLQSRLVTEFRIHNITNIQEANNFLIEYIPKYNKQFSVKAENDKSEFISLPPKVNLDILLSVKFDRTIDNSGTFSIKNNKFQVNDKHIPAKSKVQVLISEKLGIKVFFNNELYSVTPLNGLIDKDEVKKGETTVCQYMPAVMIALINEFYLKDAKA